MSEWQAYDNAMALSFQMGSWNRSSSTFMPALNTLCDTRNHHRAFSVSFEPEVEIAFFPPDEDACFFQSHSTTMKLTSLASWTHAEGKPWSSKRVRPKRRNKSSSFSSATSDSTITMTSNGDSPHGSTQPRAVQPPLPDQTWQDTIWDLLQTEGRPDIDDDDFLKSYYLDHVGHQHSGPSRPIRCSTDYTNWEQDVRFVWEDHVIAHLPIDLVFVRPQPPALQADGTVATVIVHQNPVPPRVPCLITAVLIDDPNTRILEMAHSVVPLLPPNDVLHLGGVADTCRQREQEGPDSCTLHIGFRLLPRDQAIIVEEGMGITIRVPSRLSAAEAEQNLVARVQQLRDNHPRHEWNDPEQEHPEETHPAPAGLGTTAPQPEDVTSFMARSLHSSRSAADSDSDSSVPTHDMDATDESPSHIDAESFLTVIFSLDGQERQIDAPWDDGDLLWELTGIQFEINIADVVFLHHVDHRPADIAQEGLECLLLQRQQDAPSVNFLRLCLVDVEYKADARGSQLRIDRRPKWMPRRMNRASIILLAGFGGFCALSPSRCDVWINSTPLEVNADVHELRHGDYIRIAVPSHPDDPASGCGSTTRDFPQVHLDDDLMDLGQKIVRHKRVVLQDISNVYDCKNRQRRLPDGSECEGASFVEPLIPPDVPGRPELQFGDHLECLDALHRTWAVHSAIEREDEGRVLYISTWFPDAGRWPECDESRPVRLLQDFGHGQMPLLKRGMIDWILTALSTSTSSLHNQDHLCGCRKYYRMFLCCRILWLIPRAFTLRHSILPEEIKASLDAFALSRHNSGGHTSSKQLVFCNFVVQGMLTAWYGGENSSSEMDSSIKLDMASPSRSSGTTSLISAHQVVSTLPLRELRRMVLLSYRPISTCTRRRFHLKNLCCTT